MASRSLTAEQPAQLDFLHLLFRPSARSEALMDPAPLGLEAWPFARAVRLAVEPQIRRSSRGALTASVFDAYHPLVRVPGSRCHPTPLVESAAMAAATTPPCGYRPRLPEHLVTEGILSGAQLEAVCRAGQAHAEHLPGAVSGETGARQGFFLGDATGVGRSRLSGRR